MKRLGIDLDGVVVDTMVTMLPMISDMAGKPIRLKDVKTYDLSCLDIDSEEFIRRFNKGAGYYKAPSINGAEEALNRIGKHYEIYFITSRDKDLAAVTKAWLNERKGIIYNGLVFDKLKIGVAENLGIKYMIEDNPSVLSKMNRNKIRTITFNQPWNVDYEHKMNMRVKNWAQIEKILMNQIWYDIQPPSNHKN